MDCLIGWIECVHPSQTDKVWGGRGTTGYRYVWGSIRGAAGGAHRRVRTVCADWQKAHRGHSRGLGLNGHGRESIRNIQKGSDVSADGTAWPGDVPWGAAAHDGASEASDPFPGLSP